MNQARLNLRLYRKTSTLKILVEKSAIKKANLMMKNKLITKKKRMLKDRLVMKKEIT